MDAEKAYNRAERFLDRMKKSMENRTDFEDYLSSFLSSSRSVYHYLESEFKEAGFKAVYTMEILASKDEKIREEIIRCYGSKK